MSCRVGGVFKVLLASQCDALGALVGTALNTANFEEVIPIAGASYIEEAPESDAGISYLQTVEFRVQGDDANALQAFEQKYLNKELWCAVQTSNADWMLFRNLFMSRSRNSGASPSDFNGRAYRLVGATSLYGIKITVF